MSNLSANTLFHFTPRKFLLDKFENGFSPRYNKEFDPEIDGEFFNRRANVHLSQETASELFSLSPISNPIYIPMVCFCDIPLSSLDYHMDVYSSYGIGLKKTWAETQGLNPVMYLNEMSKFFTVISGSILSTDMIMKFTEAEVNSQLDKLRKKGEDVSAILVTLQLMTNQQRYLKEELITHLKPRVCKGEYRGYPKGYSYYNEKEWRYVPDLVTRTQPIFYEGFLDEIQLNDLNEAIKDKAIDFQAKDVKYIIVENESDVEFLIDGLHVINDKTKKYTEEEIYYLTTKIITCDQIREDF